MRALACFGGDTIHIIGKIPPENELKRLSGGHSALVRIIQHKNPENFIAWARANGSYIIVAELAEGSENIHVADIPMDSPVIFVVGNEMEGIPVPITLNADLSVYIPMIGRGFCLNTSQTANILLYEYAKRAIVGE